MAREGSFLLTQTYTHTQTACVSEIRLLNLTAYSEIIPHFALSPSPVSNWDQPIECSKVQYVAHEMYSEGSWAKEQHEAPIITSNGLIFENHIRS